MPNPERPRSPQKHESSGLSVMAAGCLGMAVVLGFTVLVMAALGGGTTLGLVLLCVLAFSMIAVHYLLWGWWLGPRLRQNAER